jgi:hypothetical protein
VGVAIVIVFLGALGLGGALTFSPPLSDAVAFFADDDVALLGVFSAMVVVDPAVFTFEIVGTLTLALTSLEEFVAFRAKNSGCLRTIGACGCIVVTELVADEETVGVILVFFKENVGFPKTGLIKVGGLGKA